MLIEDLWSYSSDGLFNWFQAPPPRPPGYVRNSVVFAYKQDYRADDRHFPFKPEQELEIYCVRLKQILDLVKLGEPTIAQREVISTLA